MKKISLFTLVLMGSLAATAQDQDHKPVRTDMSTQTRFGVRAGANLATFQANDFTSGMEPTTNNKTSMHAGLFVNIPVTEMFRIQPEVIYNGMGSKMRQSVTVGTTTTTQNFEQDLSYISVPIMMQLQTNSGFFAETGPQASFLISAKQEGPGDTDTDNKSKFDKFDLAWGAGLGYLSRIGLGLNARYNFGLTNALEDGGGNNSANDGPELKNRTIQVGLVWHFGAHK